MNFCHISPAKHLERLRSRPYHLALAHLVETDPVYADFYKQCSDAGATIILDNSAFELYKQGRSMYPSDKLMEMGQKIGAQYIVMSDYPNEHFQKTIDAAQELAPTLRAEGFGTFFVPQSTIGDLDGLVQSFKWAAKSILVDYIGVSILSIPNAYNAERDNKLQRFLSRWKFCHYMSTQTVDESSVTYWDYIRHVDVNIHFLGMVDGPNEIQLIKQLNIPVTTWDSSAAIWAGLNGRQFDSSPTGLQHGKFEVEVDFDSDLQWNDLCDYNVNYIDNLCQGK